MHFSTLITALFAAIISAASAQSNATTTMFNPACYSSMPGGGYTYNSSNPFPISTNATPKSGSGSSKNGTYTTSTMTSGSGASSPSMTTGGAASASTSGPATQTGAASALDRPQTFVGLGVAALLFAAAL